jgi:HEAT repeat protein
MRIVAAAAWMFFSSVAMAATSKAPTQVAPATAPVTMAQVRAAAYPLAQADVERLRALGPGSLPHLVKLYSTSSEDDRAVIAWIFYSLGWKSPEAKAVLWKDLSTQNPKLRLQAQWALGRVSDDPGVVLKLAEIMRNDANPLFRDKAACALAYDQIHLSPTQKLQLFAKLIDGLTDEKSQVRAISIQALQIHTGQTKGFAPDAAEGERAKAVAAWRSWLAEYRSNL